MSTNEDTLSRVALAPSAVQRWQDVSRSFLREARMHGVSHFSDIPDELARVEEDGALTIYIILPDGVELSMRVDPSEWSWIGSKNH